MTESSSHSSSSVDVLRRRARRRLVGAALLALVAAIALPLMFEKEPPPLADEVDIRIPNVDKTPFEPKPISGLPGAAKEAPKTVDGPKPITVLPAPVIAAAAEKAPTSAETAPKIAEKKEEKAQIAPQVLIDAAPKTAEKKAEPPKPAPVEAKVAEKAQEKLPDAAKPADPDGPKTDPVTGDYVVQLLAVRDSNSAMKALARARELGYKTAYREAIDVSNGKVTRVRVGPYKEKAFAEKIRNKLATQEFEAVVVQIK
jgi:DedD protein